MLHPANEKTAKKKHRADDNFVNRTMHIHDHYSFFRHAFFLESAGHIIHSIVTKQAMPPIKFEIGSAKNTPFTPRLAMWGRMRVSGTTITAFLSREKKIACLAFPRPVKTVCPENCRDIKQNPKK